MIMSQSNTLRPCSSRIPCVKSVMFNIQFTYLRILDVMWDFLCGRVTQNILTTQHKCKLHLENIAIAIHSSIISPMWFPLPVSIRCSLSWCWATPVTGRKMIIEAGSRSLLSEIFLFVFLVFILCFELSHVYRLPSCWSG